LMLVCNEEGFSWTALHWWDVNRQFGIFVDCSPSNPWLPDLSEWGQVWRDALTESPTTTTTTTTTTTISTTTTTTTSSTTTTIPTVSILGRLLNVNDNPINADINVYNSSTGGEVASDSTTDGYYNLSVQPDIYDIQYNILDFFISNLWIKLISFNVFSDVVDALNKTAEHPADNKLLFIVDISTDQEIQVYSDNTPRTVKANGIEMTEVSSQPSSPNEWFYDSSSQILYLIATPVSPTTTTTTTTISSTTTTISGTTTTIISTTSTTTTTTIGTTTSSTTTTITGMVQIADCDSLTDWSTENGVHALDTDNQEGTYSINVTGDGTPWNIIRETYDPPTMDWSPYSTFKLWIKPDVTNALAVLLYTDWGNYVRWNPSVTVGEWNEVELDLNSPDLTSGSFDLTSVDWVSIQMNQPNGREVFKIDDLRVN